MNNHRLVYTVLPCVCTELPFSTWVAKAREMAELLGKAPNPRYKSTKVNVCLF